MGRSAILAAVFGVCLGSMVGVGQAHHASGIDMLSGVHQFPALAELDACIAGPDGPRPEAEWTQDCQALMADCFGLLHLPPDEFLPQDPEARLQMTLCADAMSSWAYVLLLEHSREVTEAFPRAAGEGRRAEALERFVRIPAEPTTLLGAGVCIAAALRDNDILPVCSMIQQRAALIRSRLIWAEGRP